MNIIELKERQNITNNLKLNNLYTQYKALLEEFKKKQLPQTFVETINKYIEALNASTVSDDEFKKMLKQKQTNILKLAEKELKMVPKNYYRNLWLALGMSAFGIPIGVAFGISIGNLGLLSIGLPIGMGIGIVVGLSMDKKAAAEGRQLDIEIKY